MRIGIVGVGHVGGALGTFLNEHHEVIGIDLSVKKASFPIYKDYAHLKDVDIVFIAVPTLYNNDYEALDTSLVEDAVKEVIKVNDKCGIYIKSTVGVGFTRKLINDTGYQDIFFTPEFLRQNSALEDVNNPSRLVIGSINKDNNYINVYFSLFNSSKRFSLSLEEAEAVKLFANTYLAMRVAFFNELDTFAELNDLDTNKIIEAVSSDPRIGEHYNHPSYGYGGYCLPKDSKQLASLYKNIPQELIESTVKSNDVRKEHIVNQIKKRLDKNIVGIYGEINQYSPLVDIVKLLEEDGITVIKNNDKPGTDSFYEFINKVELVLSEDKNLELHLFRNKLYLK